MPRTVHDQFAKQYLAELLTPLGSVETSREVSPEVRQIDVWFVPAAQPATESQDLGLLGQMASTVCLFEPFRNAPTPLEILDCQSKLNAINSEMRRKYRREKRSFIEHEWPRLWILSPSISERIRNGFGAQIVQSEKWPTGVYFLPEYQKTILVAINKLPVKPETLWLRVLGKNETQERAREELNALPKEHPLRQNLLALLERWQKLLPTSQNITEEDREFIMQLLPAYQRWREETLQEGRLEERREMVENLLRVRFGSLDEELYRLIEPMLQLPPAELTQLLLTLSRQELLERFGGESS